MVSLISVEPPIEFSCGLVLSRHLAAATLFSGDSQINVLCLLLVFRPPPTPPIACAHDNLVAESPELFLSPQVGHQPMDSAQAIVRPVN